MKAHRLLSIDRGDYPTLAVLAPIFASSAAVTVVLASLSKALFLSQNPIALLPWVFLGAAVITALGSLVYVSLLPRWSLRARVYGLFITSALSFVALRLTFPMSPKLVSLVILLWCPAAGSLIVMQTWNMATSTLPTRQGKRLFPVLAALTTSGAVLGGLLVQLLLLWLSTEDLLVFAALLLGIVVARSSSAIRRLLERAQPVSSAERSTALGVKPEPIRKNPLLAEISLLVFLLQAASLLVDYQFSAELQPQFDKDGIASFLGTFYWSSNLVVLLFTLMATSRFVRRVGIGIALAVSGIVLAIGSGVYVIAAVSSALSGFWVISATAFAERIAQYAFTKPAMQMAFMPMQGKGGERAKALIDGVVYRLATAVVSVLLLVAAPTVASQFRLSLPAIIACVVVVYLGSRIGPHYRKAVFEALKSHRLDNQLTSYLRDGLAREAAARLEAQLASSRPARVLDALEVAEELGVELSQARLEQLADHDDERIVTAALSALERAGHGASRALLSSILEPSRPPKLLRAVLQLLGERGDPRLAQLARPLITHPDPAVASAACVARIRAAGEDAVHSFDGEVASVHPRAPSERPPSTHRRFTGMTRAGDFARELPVLLGDANLQVRLDSIEQMGQLGLAYFVEPLIACLVDSETRNAAIEALARYGPSLADEIAAHLATDALGLPAHVALLRLLERIDAVDALLTQCRSDEPTLRDHAVRALWRLAGSEAAARPRPARLEPLIMEEIKRLRLYAAVEVQLVGAPTPRRRMFLAELLEQQRQTERRALRLLGMLYDRAALQRAQLHYRSEQARARSNAIELLEQHITDPQLRELVSIIERVEAADGKLRPRSMVLQGVGDDIAIGALLEGDAWLSRLWAWAEARADSSIDWDDDLDRVLALKDIDMLRELSGLRLLALAGEVERIDLDAGETVFAAGDDSRDVFWVMHGTLSATSAAATKSIEERGSFGLMSALDGKPRGATVQAQQPSTVLRLRFGELEDLLDLNPRLLRRIIADLTQRLRAVMP